LRAADCLRVVDKGLRNLLSTRQNFFDKVSDEYRKNREKKTRVGFEALVSAEMYRQLQVILGDDTCVFYEYPVLKGSIDLCLALPDIFVYLEIKMYYSPLKEGYGRDLKKLKAVAEKSDTLCIWIQFNYYENRSQSVKKFFQQTLNDLKAFEYETRFRTIGKASGQHFLRLAFWKKMKKGH
jgi:hypothetical protein